MEKITLDQIWLEMKNMNSKIEKGFHEVDKRFNETYKQVDRVESGMIRLDGRINRLDDRITRLDNRMDQAKDHLLIIRKQTAFLTEKVTEHGQKIDHLDLLNDVTRKHQHDAEARINRLEKSAGYTA